jgi:DNA recombination protein RmuC
MQVESLLLGLALGVLLGALAAALWAARINARVREQLARAQTELSGQGDTATRQRESFVTLSTDVLQNSQKSFLDLVRPVEASLKQVDEKLRSMEKEREGAYRELKSQVVTMGQASERLRTETATLSQALRAPHTRGRWGEIQLRRVCEMAGMLQHCDFEEQKTVTSDDGRLRPDVVVQLPGGKQVVIDAKVPLAAYLEAQRQDIDEDARS